MLYFIGERFAFIESSVIITWYKEFLNSLRLTKLLPSGVFDFENKSLLTKLMIVIVIDFNAILLVVDNGESWTLGLVIMTALPILKKATLAIPEECDAVDD